LDHDFSQLREADKYIPMDLLLTHGYFLQEDPKEHQIMKPYAPLGLLYLSSYLKSKGYAVEVFDTTFRSREELFSLLESATPAVLGIYANLMTRRNVVAILRRAKASGWQVILGGPEPANYLSEYLDAGADAIVTGEGELTLEEVLQARRRGRLHDLEKIGGLTFRAASGAIHQSPPRALIRNLDAQPWPDREAIDLRQYVETWKTHHGSGSVSLITARGCAYHCRWCSHSVYGKTHRRRRPEAVVDEIECLRHRYQPDMLWIADDVFTIHHSWLFRYAEEMKRRRLSLQFECITRADRVNEKVADALAELQCFRVWIGSESGSQRILDAMDRGVTVDEVRAAVRLCQERSIQAGMFLMWGYAGEELPDIEATIEHVKQSNPDIFLTTVAYPIKGTDYFQDAASAVVASEDWESSSDRDSRIRGRHSRRYYQFADQLLKNEVALDRLLQNSGSATAPEEIRTLRQRIREARSGLAVSIAEVEA
jgi:anaerobic magnesium-protoporphyrin IX monomethyl ester cyclase